MRSYQLASTHGLTPTTLEPLHNGVQVQPAPSHLCTHDGMRNSMVSCAVLCVDSCACPASQLASLLSAIARHVLHTALPLTQARPHDVEHFPSFY